MSKVHLVRPGTTSPYCGMSPLAGHDLRSTEDKEKFVRISKKTGGYLSSLHALRGEAGNRYRANRQLREKTYETC